MSEAYSRLSETQRQAVNWGEGAFLLLAGPGSGKTAVLTQRIVRLLEATAGETFRILALTFTNRAADEMRDRIAKSAPGYETRAFIGTFHSFCSELLHQYGHELGLGSDYRIYSSDRDREDILRAAIRGLDSDVAGALSGHKLLPTLDKLAGQLANAEQVARRFRSPAFGAAVAQAYTAYNEELIRINAQDFSALVLNCYRLMRDFPILAKRVRSTYRYWHIDEFQDTTAGQFQLLRTIAAQKFSNVFAVADDDQIIYQWNGASHKRLDDYVAEFSPTVLQLPTNYRCPPEVVGLANNLIQHNQLRTPEKKPLIAARSVSRLDAVTLLHFDSDGDEANGIAAHIEALPPEQRKAVAVLARARASLSSVKAELDARGVRSRVVVRRDAFQTAAFTWVHCILALASRRVDERALRETVAAFNNLVRIDVVFDDLVPDAKASQTDYLVTWLAAARTANPAGEGSALLDGVEAMLLGKADFLGFVDLVIDWVRAREAMEQDGIISPFEEDRQAWMAMVRDIKAARGATPSLEQFLQEMELRPKEPPMGPGEIPLMTIHAAKGNEFTFVYLIGLAEGVLPSFQSLEKGDRSAELEEERRNCFVAITRTQERLVLSYADRYRGWKKDPSRFLSEMGLLAQ